VEPFGWAAYVMFRYENSVLLFLTAYYSRRNLEYMHDVVAYTNRSASNYAEQIHSMHVTHNKKKPIVTITIGFTNTKKHILFYKYHLLRYA